MWDQNRFEEDRQEYQALGLVTRKRFGVLLGAGISMMLPQAANAVAVAESDVTVMTPDGAADYYFVHPASGTAPGVLVWPDIFGCDRRSGRWASGSLNRAIQCLW
jgi:carboxymethylenebutenolidase